ncbi:heme exporter protein CcmD [Sinimarinibacterium sp. CAU 1509]|uniref:heme exporter protein CcmD n=1 Tax=Sinimarinibacterium sp. CAU 1509 TaxID=2562283 RepID=UPI00200A5C05|nr:heme exporter protein CcmD [Sinimarinibacterium sp. CAU 1509]
MSKLLDPAFWSMSGYAVFVWGSFGLTVAVYLWNWLAPQRRRREILESVTEE